VIGKRSDYWQVKVYAGLDPLTGKERYEYDRARTKREAERVEEADGGPPEGRAVSGGAACAILG
jgi:hypothetical protein